MKKIMIAGIMSAGVLFANTNSIIIYDNVALIDEHKENVKLNKGNNVLRYDNVSPNIIVDSVLITLPEKTKLIEQNYNSNEFNNKKLVEKNINKNVIFKDMFDKQRQGTLIAVVGNNGLIKYGNDFFKDSLLLIDVNNIITEFSKDNIPEKPFLDFNIKSEEEYVKQDINFKYLSTGLGWKANYIVNINNNELELNGLITLNNNNNIDFKNYKLKVVAGDVNVNQPKLLNNNFIKRNAVMELSAMSNSDNMEAMSHGGYQIYDIPFNVDIEANSMKQIGFMKKKVNEWSKIDLINIGVSNSKRKEHFDQIIKFKNDKDNIGVPLPAGSIRLYSLNSKDNVNYFIGENSIENTAINEEVKVLIGKDFDSFITYENACNQFGKDETGSRNVCVLANNEYTINNSSNEDKVYEINADLNMFASDRSNLDIESNCLNNDICSYEVNSSGLKTFIKMKANSELNIKFKVNARKH